MKEIKDFNTEKNIYIGKVLNHIHYKKLHTRIYEELSTHLDDMYEDFSSTRDDEEEITRKVLEEMGNPDELGKELQEIHKSVLLRVKILKTIFCIILIMLTPFIFDTIFTAGEEIHNCITSFTVEEAEQWIVEERNDGKPINLLTEIEHEGVVHRIYVPEFQDEEDFNIYHIASTKFFGINIKEKFEFAHSTFLSSDDYTIADLEESFGLSDVLFIYFDTPEEKYLKVEYISREDNSRGTWSDFIEIPQDGTIENPKCVLFDCPDGYRWSKYKRFDENKEPIEWE